MPSRTLSMIRRGINRLNDLIAQHLEIAPLKTIGPTVAASADEVNAAWQKFQDEAEAKTGET